MISPFSSIVLTRSACLGVLNQAGQGLSLVVSLSVDGSEAGEQRQAAYQWKGRASGGDVGGTKERSG